jgi:hypothetical protein
LIAAVTVPPMVVLALGSLMLAENVPVGML